MIRREDYERKAPVKPKVLKVTRKVYECDQMDVATGSYTVDQPPSFVAIALTSSKEIVTCTFETPEALDAFISGLISARNGLWPSK